MGNEYLNNKINGKLMIITLIKKKLLKKKISFLFE